MDGWCVLIPADMGKHQIYYDNVSDLCVLVHTCCWVCEFPGLLQNRTAQEQTKPELSYVDTTSKHLCTYITITIFM